MPQTEPFESLNRFLQACYNWAYMDGNFNAGRWGRDAIVGTNKMEARCGKHKYAPQIGYSKTVHNMHHSLC